MIGDFQVVDHRLTAMFAVHVNPAECSGALRHKRMAGKKLGLLLQVVASYIRLDLTDSGFGLVEGHGIHKNAGVIRLAVQSRKGCGLAFPHADLKQVARDLPFLLVTQQAIPNGNGRGLKPALNI